MDWTKDLVINELPKIRTLKGVSSAYAEGSRLIVSTSNVLGHPSLKKNTLPSIDISIPIEDEESYVLYRYHNRTDKKEGLLHNTHPVTHPIVRIYNYWEEFCAGDNMADYRRARGISPYMTVIQQLTMLQTITGPKRPHSDGGIEIEWESLITIGLIVLITCAVAALLYVGITIDK